MTMVRCVVTDLDRTLTGEDLIVDDAAIDRIRQLRYAGVRVVVATGRRFDDVQVAGLLRRVDGMVAENGAVVYVPSEDLLEIGYSQFADVARHALGDLAQRFEWGRVVASGPRELAEPAEEALDRAGVPHHAEFNAEHVMLLPADVDKATGAARCLQKLEIDVADTWAIGDGENDAALLRWAGMGAAPANAAPAALEAADVMLLSSYSMAFLELTEPLVREAAAGSPRS